MTTKHFFSALWLFISVVSSAQEKAIDTVFIFDHQLRSSKKFHTITTLAPEDLRRNTTNLSELLRFQSPVYIKENGRGAVSSPSFRGTTAQQTAFVWNGINVNSVFLGQGDVNNVSPLTYDQLDIKSGGGSVIYGSGAIGGTIHLNNDLSFSKGFEATLFGEYGSFNTRNALVKTSFSDEKLSVKVSANVVASENDYEVPERNYSNINGEYNNRTFNIGAAYKLNLQNKILWQTQFFDAVQNYPTSQFGNKTKYLSNTFRSLLGWQYQSNRINNNLKFAYLTDDFQYFDDINLPKTSGGVGQTILLKNDFNYVFSRRFAANVISEAKVDQAHGYESGITNVSRNAGSVAGLIRWNATNKIAFEAGIKKDFVESITTPVLYSFSGKVNLDNWHSMVLNVSKNFRYPSFNDLYWQPGGNLDLKSEVSHQVEFGNTFKYNNFRLSVTPYYIKIKDMIRWLPTNEGYWKPMNTDNVESYGVEGQLNFEKNFRTGKAKVSAGYAFTHSKNKDTDQFLMYVPQHKVFGSASYQYRIGEIFLQGMYNGLTYTTSNESLSNAFDPYTMINAGLNLTVYKNYQLGFKLNNILNEIYETTAYYPLPKRNYSTHLLINF